MNRRSRKRLSDFVALASLVSAAILGRPAAAIENLKVGEAFPDFSLPRSDGTSKYTLEQIKGKPAVVIFWRPRQKLSLEGLRALQAVADEIGREKFRIVAVCAGSAAASEVQAALAGENLSFPFLLDPKRALYGKIGVIVSPTTVMLDAEGILRFVLASYPRTYRQVIQARLKFLLGQINEEEMNREVQPTVLKIDHDLAAAWRMYNLGRRLQSEGKAEEALAVFEEAVSRYPSLSEARCALGFTKYLEGDLEAAGKHFQAALVYSPASAPARLGKAVILARTGYSEEAERILLSLLAHRSVMARARYELGRIYHARGENDRAVTFFREALAVIFPEPPLAPAVSSTGPVTRATAAPEGTVPAAHGNTSQPLSPSPTDATSGAAHSTSVPERSTVTPVTPPADAKYIGVKGCKKCHFQQWRSWRETKMAQAFDLLRPGVRGEVKQARNLDPRQDYTVDPSCLPCHTTGFGFPGGYPQPPPSDETDIAAAEEVAAVGCEACHGPGSKFSLLHKSIQDKQRKYTQKELYDAGQYEVGEGVCLTCHSGNGPCIAPGTVFDFVKRKQDGTHKHYALQFRTP